MTGFELQTSGVGSNRSTNWATTTARTPEPEPPLLSIIMPSLRASAHSTYLGTLVFSLIFDNAVPRSSKKR